MNKVVDAPVPPYYAAIAPAELCDDVRGYPEMAAMLAELAKEQPGFIGIESGVQKGFTLAVSYWESLEAIQAWSKPARLSSIPLRAAITVRWLPVRAVKPRDPMGLPVASSRRRGWSIAHA